MDDGLACGDCGAQNLPGRKFCGECGSALSLACAACGSANPGGVKFCGECGTSLAAPAPTPPQPTAERRLVSVLFADLVGFTAASEERDAEETRELLSRYFETARAIVGRYGGVVEKFIGDAVMAVWGTPVAQEDDAERAVRAALELISAIPDLDPALRARAGVLTGEAAVTLGAGAEGMVAGDLVNSASRVQSVAEPGTVLVGESTKRASEAAVAFADAGAHEVKGKSEPLHLWQALRVVSNRGGEGRSSVLEAPFVGRDREFRLVKDLCHAAAEDRRATLATVVGVAGIGKSRLAWELEKHLDGLADMVWWHRGRCLAYGEGVAFWALAEMVRMRARISDDEPPASALAKLAAAAERHVPDLEERAWMEPLLAHLLGLGERVQVDRSDLFSAWRLFFERMSDTAPVVLVFEDLHWADTALLDFVEHLLEWSRARPIFVLALTRPELLDRRGDFGSHSRSSTTLVLEPLDTEAMDALLAGLVPGLPDELVAQIRERADGIPLYAVETVRMLLDRGVLARDGDALRVTGPLNRLAVPETLQALIASRLDGLDPAERQLLQHAAVLGKTFAPRALAVLGGVGEESLAPLLERLVRMELLTVDLDPRSPERGQYGFLQALVQRVAYDTLARRERARLHRAAAAYLEHDAGVDPDAIAEVIAAHHRDACAADPSAPEAAESRAAACDWLVRAAERAASLAAPDDAMRAYDDAAAIAEEPLDRARLLEQAGKLALQAGRMTDAEERLRASVDAFTGAGETHAAARAAATLGVALWNLDRSDEALATLRPAFAALADDAHDADLGRLAAELARIEHFAGENEQAREHVELALDIAERETDPGLLSEALNTKGLLARGSRPHESRALLSEALRIAEEHDLTPSALRAINNLAVLASLLDRLDEVDELRERALALARSRGHRGQLSWFGAAAIGRRLTGGSHDEAFALAAEVLPEGVLRAANPMVAALQLARASVDRGDEEGARAWLDRLPEDLAESTDVTNNAGMAGFRTALLSLIAGRLADSVQELVDTFRRFADNGNWPGCTFALNWGADGALLLGDPAAAAPLADLYETMPPPVRTRFTVCAGARLVARRAAAAGDEDAAADAFAEALAAARSLDLAGVLAPLLCDYGSWLADCGRVEEAVPLLDEASSLFAGMGAVRWLELLDATRARAAEPAVANVTNP